MVRVDMLQNQAAGTVGFEEAEQMGVGRGEVGVGGGAFVKDSRRRESLAVVLAVVEGQVGAIVGVGGVG